MRPAARRISISTAFALLALLSGVDAKAAKPHSPRPKETPTDTSLYWRSRYFEKRWQKELQHDTVGSLLYPKIVEWIQQAPSPGELREFLSGLQNSTAARRLDSAQRVVWNRTMARHARAESRQDWRDAYENAGFVNSEGVFQLEVSRTNLRPGDTLLFQPRYFYGLESDMPDSLQLEISRVDLDSMGNGVSATPVDTVLAKPDGTRRGMWRLAKRLPGSGIWRISQLGDQTFHEQFVQVSWLDVAASRDASRLLVWGTSLKGAVPPPYTVRIRLSDGKWRTESTDSNGVLDVAVDTTSPYRNGSFSIVLESQGNLAFLQTGYLNTRNEDAETMTWIWTDRPSFRPGDMVHFHAMSARFTGPGSFRIEKADSRTLCGSPRMPGRESGSCGRPIYTPTKASSPRPTPRDFW